jgi:hypothetical protein
MLTADQKRRMDEMLAKQAMEFKGLEKHLKMDSDDEADPELRELNKQLAKRGIGFHL